MKKYHSEISKNAKKDATIFAEKLHEKLKYLNYPHLKTEKTGALNAGIIDIHEGLNKIYNHYLPKIIDKNNLDKDDISTNLIDMYWEFKHILRHIEDMGDSIIDIANFLNKSGIK